MINPKQKNDTTVEIKLGDVKVDYKPTVRVVVTQRQTIDEKKKEGEEPGMKSGETFGGFTAWNNMG